MSEIIEKCYKKSNLLESFYSSKPNIDKLKNKVLSDLNINNQLTEIIGHNSTIKSICISNCGCYI